MAISRTTNAYIKISSQLFNFIDLHKVKEILDQKEDLDSAEILKCLHALSSADYEIGDSKKLIEIIIGILPIFYLHLNAFQALPLKSHVTINAGSVQRDGKVTMRLVTNLALSEFLNDVNKEILRKAGWQLGDDQCGITLRLLATYFSALKNLLQSEKNAEVLNLLNKRDVLPNEGRIWRLFTKDYLTTVMNEALYKYDAIDMEALDAQVLRDTITSDVKNKDVVVFMGTGDRYIALEYLSNSEIAQNNTIKKQSETPPNFYQIGKSKKLPPKLFWMLDLVKAKKSSVPLYACANHNLPEKNIKGRVFSNLTLTHVLRSAKSIRALVLIRTDPMKTPMMIRETLRDIAQNFPATRDCTKALNYAFYGEVPKDFNVAVEVQALIDDEKDANILIFLQDLKNKWGNKPIVLNPGARDSFIGIGNFINTGCITRTDLASVITNLKPISSDMLHTTLDYICEPPLTKECDRNLSIVIEACSKMVYKLDLLWLDIVRDSLAQLTKAAKHFPVYRRHIREVQSHFIELLNMVLSKAHEILNINKVGTALTEDDVEQYISIRDKIYPELIKMENEFLNEENAKREPNMREFNAMEELYFEALIRLANYGDKYEATIAALEKKIKSSYIGVLPRELATALDVENDYIQALMAGYNEMFFGNYDAYGLHDVLSNNLAALRQIHPAPIEVDPALRFEEFNLDVLEHRFKYALSLDAFQIAAQLLLQIRDLTGQPDSEMMRQYKHLFIYALNILTPNKRTLDEETTKSLIYANMILTVVRKDAAVKEIMGDFENDAGINIESLYQTIRLGTEANFDYNLKNIKKLITQDRINKTDDIAISLRQLRYALSILTTDKRRYELYKQACSQTNNPICKIDDKIDEEDIYFGTLSEEQPMNVTLYSPIDHFQEHLPQVGIEAVLEMCDSVLSDDATPYSSVEHFQEPLPQVGIEAVLEMCDSVLSDSEPDSDKAMQIPAIIEHADELEKAHSTMQQGRSLLSSLPGALFTPNHMLYPHEAEGQMDNDRDVSCRV